MPPIVWDERRALWLATLPTYVLTNAHERVVRYLPYAVPRDAIAQLDRIRAEHLAYSTLGSTVPVITWNCVPMGAVL